MSKMHHSIRSTCSMLEQEQLVYNCLRKLNLLILLRDVAMSYNSSA